MPSVRATCALVWGAAAKIRSTLVAPWRDGVRIRSLGGPFVPGPPPVGGTPTDTDNPVPTFPDGPVLVTHTVAVYDDRDDTLLDIQSFSLSTDSEQPMWAFSATGSEETRRQLLSGVQPAIVRVEIDDDVSRFVIDSIARDREFGLSRVQLSGKSPTVVAGSFYQGDKNWSLDGDTTAAQLCTFANTYTDVEIDWQLEDWFIPAGAFSFTGSPMAVVQRVAEAVKAVVQTDRGRDSLVVMPRYPRGMLPAEWDYSRPDVEIPESAVRRDSIARTDQPPYNAVLVTGQQDGYAAVVVAAGTDGGVMKPMVSDALLTDSVAVTERGLSELGSGGMQTRVTRTLPIIPGVPGILEVGQLARFIDADETWTGMVRSVSVDVAFPSVTQTIAVERHTESKIVSRRPGTVVIMLHGNSTPAIDSSVNAWPVTPTDAAAVTLSRAVMGAGSLDCSASGYSRFYVGPDAALNPFSAANTTRSWQAQCWFTPSAATLVNSLPTIFSAFDLTLGTPTVFLAYESTPHIVQVVVGTQATSYTYALEADVPVHFRIAVVAGKLMLYINGTLVYDGSLQADVGVRENPLRWDIGGYDTGSSGRGSLGWIDDFQLVIGGVRPTISAPTRELPNT